jgi:hypothetical protein
MALQDKVVDFTAWRRARPIVASVAAPNAKDAAGSGEIVPIFGRKQAAIVTPVSLPAFDYRGSQLPVPAAALPPAFGSSVISPAVPGGAISLAQLLPATIASQHQPGQHQSTQRQSIQHQAPQPQATRYQSTQRQKNARGETVAASETVTAGETGVESSATRPIGKWHRGLAWFVGTMAGGVITTDNLQAILSDMQDELDALEGSMQRLRVEDDDLELAADPARPVPGMVRMTRRACDITGQAMASHPAGAIDSAE